MTFSEIGVGVVGGAADGDDADLARFGIFRSGEFEHLCENILAERADCHQSVLLELIALLLQRLREANHIWKGVAQSYHVPNFSSGQSMAKLLSEIYSMA